MDAGPPGATGRVCLARRRRGRGQPGLGEQLAERSLAAARRPAAGPPPRPPRPVRPSRRPRARARAAYGQVRAAPTSTRAPGLVGAAGQRHDPPGGVVAVVAHLLDALGCHRGEHRVDRAAQRLEEGQPPGREAASRTTASAKSVSRLLDQPDAAELVGPAEERQPVLGRAPASPPAAQAPRRGRRRRRARTAAGSGRAGRARCSPAPPPPRAPGRGCTTGSAAAPSPARRRRASGSTPRAPARRPRPGPRRRGRPAGRRTRCRKPSGRRCRPRPARRRRCRRVVAHRLTSHVRDVVGDVVEGGVPVDLVAAGREERVLLVGARRGDRRPTATTQMLTPSLRRV